ncbi:MAG: histidine phosphatase family protein [Gammaproteobacteria bacterium]|nr:histidine phosphatase family protein [Gammaproteobacteria bacterium]
MFIDLLRHGEVAGKSCFRGHTDQPLSKTGWQQMAAALEDYTADIVLSSPLQRCADFSAHWSDAKNISAVFMPEFKEINFGDWDGLTADEIALTQADELHRFWDNPASVTPPKGESLAEFQQRIVNGWDSLIEKHHGQHVLLVTHGGVIKILVAHVLSMPVEKLLSIETPLAAMSRIRIMTDPAGMRYSSLVFHAGKAC